MRKFDHQASKARHGSKWRTLCDSERYLPLTVSRLGNHDGGQFLNFSCGEMQRLDALDVSV